MMRLGNVLRVSRTEVRRFASKHPVGSDEWRRRLAISYAMSMWAVFGILIYSQWPKKDKSQSPKTDDELFMDLEEDPTKKRKPRFEFSTSIEYKDNQLPYTTRIYQYFTQSNKTSDIGSTEN